MNKQLIGDLFAESQRQMTGGSSREFSEKFAELIVAECLAQVGRVDDMLEDEPAQKAAVAWVGSAIADHFGVEDV